MSFLGLECYFNKISNKFRALLASLLAVLKQEPPKKKPPTRSTSFTWILTRIFVEKRVYKSLGCCFSLANLYLYLMPTM